MRGPQLKSNSSHTNIFLLKDDEDHYAPNRDHRGPRRRNEPPVPVRLRKQLLDISDSPLRGVHEEIKGVAQLLADNYDDLRLRETFVDLALQLVVEQPLKTPFVAAVVLVVNTLTYKPVAAQNGEDVGGDTSMVEGQGEEPVPTSGVVDDLLAKAAAAIEENVKAGDWRSVKLYLKLLACLQSCLEGEGVFPILDALFDRAVELQTASSEDVSHRAPSDSTANNTYLQDFSDYRPLAPNWSRLFYSQYLMPSRRPPANARGAQLIYSTKRTLLRPNLTHFKP